LTLRTGTAKFAGAVVNVEGRPVAGARVTVFVDALLEGGGWIPTAGEATTGKDGAFEIPRAGTNGEALRVHIHADAYRDLEARGAAGDTSARLVVKPRVYVRGKLVAKDTGKPLQADPMKFIFVDIDVTPSSPEPSRVKAQFQTAREALHLDASGGFVVEARPGRNDVRVLFDGYKPFVKLGVVVEDDGLDVGTIELEPRKK
jgi:hypothetical protein